MKPPIKIAFVIHYLGQGGAERVVSALANFFSSQYEVVIIMMFKDDIFYELNSSVKLRYARHTPASSNAISAILNNWSTVRNLNQIIREEKIDILIGFTTTVNVITVISSLTTKTPCIISERNNAKLVPPNFFWSTLRNIFYNRSSFLVVQTEGNKDFYKSILDEHKIKIFQNPISNSLTVTPKEDFETKSKINLLAVGRLNSNKAYHISLKALARIKHLDWEFTIVGDGPLLHELIGLSKSLDIEKRVRFMGQIEDVAECYKNADILLFTSRSEGFPNVLIEASAFGLPIISTDCDYGPSDIIEDGTNGFLIPVDDDKALEDRIIKLISSKETRREFSKNALINSSRFSMDFIASQWKDIMLKAIASST